MFKALRSVVDIPPETQASLLPAFIFQVFRGFSYQESDAVFLGSSDFDLGELRIAIGMRNYSSQSISIDPKNYLSLFFHSFASNQPIVFFGRSQVTLSRFTEGLVAGCDSLYGVPNVYFRQQQKAAQKAFDHAYQSDLLAPVVYLQPSGRYSTYIEHQKYIKTEKYLKNKAEDLDFLTSGFGMFVFSGSQKLRVTEKVVRLAKKYDSSQQTILLSDVAEALNDLLGGSASSKKVYVLSPGFSFSRFLEESLSVERALDFDKVDFVFGRCLEATVASAINQLETNILFVSALNLPNIEIWEVENGE